MMISKPLVAAFASACLLTGCHQPTTTDAANVQTTMTNGVGPVMNTSGKVIEPAPSATPITANGVNADLPPTVGKTSEAKPANPDETTIEGGEIEKTAIVGGKRVDLLSNAKSPDATVGAADYLLLIDNVPAVHETGIVSMGVVGPYILLEIESGGTACPATYEIVDPSGAEPKVTKPFGSCSDLAKSHLATDGGLIVKTPRFGSAKASVVRYLRGTLTAWE